MLEAFFCTPSKSLRLHAHKQRPILFIHAFLQKYIMCPKTIKPSKHNPRKAEKINTQRDSFRLIHGWGKENKQRRSLQQKRVSVALSSTVTALLCLSERVCVTLLTSWNKKTFITSVHISAGQQSATDYQDRKKKWYLVHPSHKTFHFLFSTAEGRRSLALATTQSTKGSH